MDHTPAKATTLRPTVFRDGFGERRRMADASGNEKLEVLCLGRDLATADGFEAALRQQVARLASFRHDHFARVRAVERLNDPAATLVVVSEPTKGTRLSELLNIADRDGFSLDGSAEWCLIKQLCAAVSSLHRHEAAVAHGAIAPERIVITAEGRLMVVEHVFAPALERLGFSPERSWTELRVASAPGSTELHQRTDVTQIGVVALSLILGRPLSSGEFPARIEELVESAWAKRSVLDVEPTPPGLRVWLSRALQLDARHSFASAIDAAAELQKAFDESGYPLAPADVEAFLTRCQQPPEAPRPVAAPPAPPAPAVTATKEATTTTPKPSPALHVLQKAAPAAAAPTAPASSHKTTLLSVTRTEESHPPEAPAPSIAARVLAGVVAQKQLKDWRRAAAASAALIVVAGLGWAVASRSSEVRAEPGTEIAAPKAAPADTTATSAAPAIDPAVAVLDTPAFGQLDIRTEPVGAAVTLDGVRRGVTPLTISDVAPGRHTVILDNGVGSATRAVMVEAGLTASVVTQLPTTPATPASGFLTVTAPSELQLFENGRLLGTSRGGRLSLAAGPHQIEFVNDALGYRSTRTIQVPAGANASVNLEFPKGTLALNAIPWAEVWVDGERVGETPIGNLPVTLGSHEVVFRNPELGEQRMVATVTLTAPTRLSVDLRKK